MPTAMFTIAQLKMTSTNTAVHVAHQSTISTPASKSASFLA